MACSNPTATSLTACALRGDVGCTTRASGALSYAHEISETAGSTIATNARTSTGRSRLGSPLNRTTSSRTGGARRRAWRTTPRVDWISGRRPAKVASACGVELPRISGGEYVGIVGSCGGHTGYHFHGGFECFESGSGTHSTKVGGRVAGTCTGVEDFAGGSTVSRRVRWALRDDAGFALDVGVSLSHPAGRAVHARMSRSNNSGGLVTVAQCRALYTACSGSTSRSPSTALR